MNTRTHFRLALALSLATAPLLANASASPAFPLQVSADGRYLVDSTGAPFFYHADTAWQLPKKATLAVAEEYFDRRVKDGFTAIQLHTVSKEIAPVCNLNGDEPFVPLEDILKPNEAYWRHLDTILEAAEKRGLFVSIAALWIRWGGQDKEGWRSQLTEDNARPYGRFLGQRYAARKNILWILEGDANPGEKQKAISLLAQGLKETAPHHLTTVHNAPEHSSAAFFAGESWLDINAAYTYRETYGHVLSEWSRAYPNQRPRPIFLIESGYEHESNDQRPGDPFRVRRQAYGAILSGALMGHAYGHRELWRFSGQWRQGLDDVGSKQMRHVKELFAARAWWKLEPDNDSRLVVGGRGQAGEVDYVTAAVAKDGSFAILYLPQARPITADLTRLSPGADQKVGVAWFNPTTGGSSRGKGSPLPPTANREFIPPGKKASADNDWVLTLESAGSATPSKSEHGERAPR